ncbi:hypothetical protein [Acetobacter aceti]|uniref:Uncharacterized protein n=1 Tax=Acetobacter aceti TaxID=435 RepID=A0A6S6PMT0_ACEAC|nr:hypothetical protein [Acetobacter aceti]BCI68799.1 hypothetical protein AAJCM20276_34230 [Acetobacter aceti]
MKIPAIIGPRGNPPDEDAFEKACRDANVTRDDPIYFILREMRAEVANLNVMLHAIQSRNADLESRLLAVLQQVRTQDQTRIQKSRSEIERIVTHKMATFPMRGFFGSPRADAGFCLLALVGLTFIAMLLGGQIERYRGFEQAAFGHPLLLRDMGDVMTDLAQNEVDATLWASLMEVSRGHMAEVVRECKETTQTDSQGTSCTVHLRLPPPK